MEDSTLMLISLMGLVATLAGIFLLLRCCWVQGTQCMTKNRIDERTVLITEADTGVGVELVRELARRGARVIMAVKDIELATDVAVEVRGETNSEVSAFSHLANGPYIRQYIKGQNLNFYLETHASNHASCLLHSAQKLGTLSLRVHDP